MKFNYLKKTARLLFTASLLTGMPLASNIVLASELQTHVLSVQMESASLKELFDIIEEKFNYSFLIRNNDIDLNERISLNIKNKSVEEILTNALKNQKAEFVVNDNRIIVYKTSSKANLKSTETLVSQQSIKVTGTIVDALTGDPVIGANVIIKGTSTGTSTDFDGKFSMEAPVGSVLTVSYIGYISMEVKALATPMSIRIKEDTKTIDEIVVVGYGVQRRESLTGAMQTLNNEKITNVTTPAIENMLNGKAPGVYVAPGTGQPGSAGSIIIRGRSSINGITDPLWVVDGVIVGNKSDESLNPSDIESMTILKDAASTAIYGSQGANGVIVVTTKRAKGDKLTISASAKLGITSLSNGNLEVMSGSELYDYYKSFSNQEQITFPRWNEKLRDTNYDWWDVASQTGIAQDYNISIAGGSEKSKSYFSLGMYDEKGAVKGYDYKRYSIRYKTDYKPFDFLTIKPMIAGSRKDIDDREYSINAMYGMLPWDSPYKQDGSPTGHRSDTWVNSNATNYLYDLQWNKKASKAYSFTGNIDFDVKITDWLTFSSVNNFAWENFAKNFYIDPRSNDGKGVSGRLQEYDRKIEQRYTNQIVRLNKMFGKHSVNGLVAYEFSDYRQKWTNAVATGFVPGFEVLDVTAKPEKTSGAIYESAMQSYLFNVNYAYDNKYLAQVSFRRDGASNFGDNAKYGNFFSLSGGWNINREEFFTVDWVDALKLRAAYGSVGNRPGDRYPQYDLYSLAQRYNELSGALINQIGNKDLTWEKTYTFGVGLDFNAFDRVRLSLDYYKKKTNNILYKVPISALTGVTSIWQNVGELENKGFEVTLGGDIIKTKDLLWSLDFNLGLNRNKIQKLYGEQKQIIMSNIGGPSGSAARLLKPGFSSDTWYLREWAGVNPETGAPQWYRTVKDAQGVESRVITEKYAESNEVDCGSYSPDFFGGFSTEVVWKQFDMNAVFGYSVGGKIYNYSRQEFDSDGAYTDRNQMKLQKDWSRWEKPGDVATHPKPAYNNSSNANKVSSRYLEDGDYLKLRSLSLGYNMSLPQYYISNLRVFITAENLFTITKYSGVDPEISVKSSTSVPPRTDDGMVTGVSGVSSYPITRKFMFGINITL